MMAPAMAGGAPTVATIADALYPQRIGWRRSLLEPLLDGRHVLGSGNGVVEEGAVQRLAVGGNRHALP